MPHQLLQDLVDGWLSQAHRLGFSHQEAIALARLRWRYLFGDLRPDQEEEA